MSEFVELSDIEQAHRRIEAYIHRTPVITSEQLNQLVGGELFFKCENLQKAGTFKARGATNAVLGLDAKLVGEGVATHSSGNHAAALARAAGLWDIPTHIVMPANAPQVKKDAVLGYGGNIIECEPGLTAREETLHWLVQETGAEVVHPYTDARVVAGQGTVALEFLEQVVGLDLIVVPVGGGGLLAGVATAVKALNPNIEVMAAEPAGADDAFRSFGLGTLVPQTNPQTIADGLRSSLGEPNYEVVKRCVDTIVTVEEQSIIAAMQLQWTRLKSVVEPSAAVGFAAALEYPGRFKGRKAGLVITGGNLDLSNLPF